MTSNRRLDLTIDARDDVRNALRVTRQQWGADQRVRYARQLKRAMEQLTRFPELGQGSDHISAGLRALQVEQHVIYYRVSESEIRVIRVLHVRMDAAAHLGG